MAIINCKRCGGTLNIIEGSSVAECEFCGSLQTVPKVDDEKKLTLFARANRLRSACEFDKAAGIYEAIIADFPDEAEAYWGLVLCKYGIEYVDDPATGKKIPTCHRSSYDSVMDDSNFEQAVENADLMAQRVYREEAKQIENIRKGILEVSSKEQPYDIFICYKETAPNGDRTLDSVLAQDLYSALTDKGYRVFFSRITLRDKLGEAYEPYIFAALNSAKVMLAVGTCYEYYNAVWVKNEWSRYLKICEADKSKHLIPCYKNLDPEDMPKEFNHLQGADLGKMGAVQDILFNMEKYIPLKKQTTTVIQEKVVVGGSGGNKIASLLDRGNMALEDGDWAKADSFFEDVLNNDSKNAQAYLGKTLAQEKCRTIDAFVRKRKDACNTVRTQTYTLTPKESHINAAAEEYFVPGYLDKAQIRKMYEFVLSYSTQVPFRKQQCKDEESYWANHKLLSKAEKFATGAVADNLQAEKKALFSYLSDLVKKAEDAETVAKEKVLQGYNAHIAQTDEEVAQLREKSLQRREKDYQKWLQEVKKQSDAGNNEAVLRQLRLAAEFFEAQKAYKDSASLAQHCRKRIEDIKAENARIAAERYAAEQAEAERQRMEAEKAAEAKRLADEKAAAEKKKKIKTTVSIISAIAVVCIVVAVIMVTVVIPNNQYNAAVALMESGSYDEAIAAFEKMNGYKDSREQIAACESAIQKAEQEAVAAQLEAEYEAAMALMDAGKYEEAMAAFDAMDGYKDSEELSATCYTTIMDTKYYAAADFEKAGDYANAYALYDALGEYRDSLSRKDAVASILCSDDEERLMEAMKVSIAEAYLLLEDWEYESELLQQMSEICETFYPLCGKIEFGKVEWRIHSDFYWDGTTVYWKQEQASDSVGRPFGVGVNGVWKYFFENPVPVENMQIIEKMDVDEARITIRDGLMYFEMGYYSGIWDEDYNKIGEEFKVMSSWTGSKVEQ